MCDVPSIAVFCSEPIECFPGTASKFFLKLLVTIPVAPIITSTIVHLRFHIRCISIHNFLYFNFFSPSFYTTFLSAGIATSISVHVFSFSFNYYIWPICFNFSVCVYCLILLLLLFIAFFFLFGSVFIPVFLITCFVSVYLAACLTGQQVFDTRRQGFVCFIQLLLLLPQLLVVVVVVVVVVVAVVLMVTATIF